MLPHALDFSVPAALFLCCGQSVRLNRLGALGHVLSMASLRADNSAVPEPRLIRRAQRGCRRSRAALLRLQQDAIYRFCMGLLGCPDHAADATQETALRFCRDLPRFRGDAKLLTWTLGIALNVCRESRRRSRPMAGLSAMDDPASLRFEPSAEAEQAEQREQLRDLLGQLPPRQREVVVLRYFEQLSVEEAAAVMGCAPGTVKAAHFQAIRNLRKQWSPSHEPVA